MDSKKSIYYFNIFLNITRTMYMNFEKEWDAEARLSGITYAQQHCLWLLHVQDGLTLEELGNIGQWNKSTTSALVSRLEKKNLIRKEKEERSRTIHIYLTDQGKEKIHDSLNTPEALKFLSMFDDVEEERFARFLEEERKIMKLVLRENDEDINRFLLEYSQNLLK